MTSKEVIKMDTKEEILKNVNTLFAQKGYSLSMSDIAKSVGIKVPSIYNHFTGKDEIIWTAIQIEVADFFEFMDMELSQINATPSLERLKRLFFSIIQYFAFGDKIQFWRNMSLISNPELRKRTNTLICDMENNMYKKLQMIFIECLPGKKTEYENIENIVLFYFLMIKGLLDVMITHQDIQFELNTYVDKIWSTYWGLINRE